MYLAYFLTLSMGVCTTRHDVRSNGAEMKVGTVFARLSHKMLSVKYIFN